MTVAGAGHGKLEYLNSIEEHVPVEADVDKARKKYFVNFPYPYMNGKLHLGHLYSFSKADFTAYYKRLCGYNVLLPFAFHCTGMPISASASKLCEELAGRSVDVSVVGILASLGIEDPRPFTDPVHWIKTFPGLARATLTDYHACIDWRRSFITTDINPYYDSFVRYQFNRLRAAGRICFGKRYSIFCTIDQQPCLDHDRRRGEGIKPVEVVLLKVALPECILLVRCPRPQAVKRVVVSRVRELVEFESVGQRYAIEEELYENLKYQVADTRFVGKARISEEECVAAGLRGQSLSGAALSAAGDVPVPIGFTENDMNPKIVYGECSEEAENGEYEEIAERRNVQMVLVETEHYVKMYEPGGAVISRSGSRCIVSLLDQWFLNYGDDGWKAEVKECIDGMELTEDTRAKLDDALVWIDKWGCSRSFGLGTRLPWDRQYFIDSLSDSTIYMAFYTVKHFLFDDLEGCTERFPASLMCDEVWEFILAERGSREVLAGCGLEEGHIGVLERCKESFEYFYPVDLRVTGKDLIGNHLTFFLFNHVALFGRRFWPRRIFTNGLVLLNSAKMSKSDGNFLSAEDSIRRYGASATRMCLALCGDTNEDANFEESTANALVLKLYTLARSVEGLREWGKAELESAVRGAMAGSTETLDGLLDTFLIQALSKNVTSVIEAYEGMVFRDAVKYGFYDSLRLIDQYTSMMHGKNDALVAYAYKTVLQMMYPVIPSLSTSLLNRRFAGDLSLPTAAATCSEQADAVAHADAVCSRIMAGRRDTHRAVTIGTWHAFPEWKMQCMAAVDSLRGHAGDERTVKLAIISKIQPILAGAGVSRNKGILFAMDYYKNCEGYRIAFDEFATLSLLQPYIAEMTGLDVSVTRNEKGEPLAPVLRFE